MEKLVFIIDDDQVYLNFMKSHFHKMEGYQVEGYANGDEAMVQLERREPFILIQDHNLVDPDKNGLYYLKKIKKLKPRLPVIYITSDNSTSLKKEVLGNGASALIVKGDAFLVQLRTTIDEISAPKKGFFSKLFGG
jgi:DNA-binding response OmpR family regulator